MPKTIIGQQHLDTALQLLLEMLRVDTSNPPGNEMPLARLIAEAMTSRGLEAEVRPLADNRANVVGRLKGRGNKPALLLNGHLDVVPPGSAPWKRPPFDPIVEGGKVWGRGAADMKGGLAAMLAAMFALQETCVELGGDVIFAGTAGEESDSLGAVHFVREGGLQGVGGIIVGEASSCRVNIAEKGALWLELQAHGKTAHSAFPEQGHNAVAFMNGLLADILSWKLPDSPHPLLGRSTLSLSSVHGGVKTNVVPDHCTACLDIRCVPGLSHAEVMKGIQALCDAHLQAHPGISFSLAIHNDRAPVETDPTHPFVEQALTTARKASGKEQHVGGVSFYSDASVFAPAANIPIILYGPGDASMAHQPNEYIHVDSLKESIIFYAAFMESWLGNA